jgi:hypothetical protein
MRLVMPPALGMILAYPIWTLYEAILPLGIGPGVISGAMMGFVLYDMIHCKSTSFFFRFEPRSRLFRPLTITSTKIK